jgi:hypothetical protein
MFDTIKQIEREMNNHGEAKRRELVADYIATRRKHDPTVEGLDNESLIRDALKRDDDELASVIAASKEIESLQAQIVPDDEQSRLDEASSSASKTIVAEVAKWEQRMAELQKTENEAAMQARTARQTTVDAKRAILRCKEKHPSMFGVSPKAPPVSEAFSIGLHGERQVAGPTIRHDEIAAGLM